MLFNRSGARRLRNSMCVLKFSGIVKYSDKAKKLIEYALGEQDTLLPARTSEQGNIIGLVRIYICKCTKKCN